jgi:hypothetical protein
MTKWEPSRARELVYRALQADMGRRGFGEESAWLARCVVK